MYGKSELRLGKTPNRFLSTGRGGRGDPDIIGIHKHVRLRSVDSFVPVPKRIRHNTAVCVLTPRWNDTGVSILGHSLCHQCFSKDRTNIPWYRYRCRSCQNKVGYKAKLPFENWTLDYRLRLLFESFPKVFLPTFFSLSKISAINLIAFEYFR